MDFCRLSESTDGFRQQMSKVRDRDFFRNLRLRLLRRMNHMWLVFDQCPFETFLCAVHIETFTVLPRYVIQTSPDMRRQIRVPDFNVAGFHSELVAGLFGNVIANSSGTEATDVFGQSIDQSKTRAHHMSRIMHRNHLFPVTRPAVHILRMRRGEMLNFAEFPFLVHFFDKQIFAAVNDGFGHHVLQAGLLDFFHNLTALFDGRRHWNGTNHMLASIQRFE